MKFYYLAPFKMVAVKRAWFWKESILQIIQSLLSLSLCIDNNYTITHSKEFGVPTSSKVAHDILCAVHTFFMVCIAHLIWCVMNTIFGVENTLYTVCYYIAFYPGLAFAHVNMYNIDTIQLQSSHKQCSKCVILLSNVFV